MKAWKEGDRRSDRRIATKSTRLENWTTDEKLRVNMVKARKRARWMEDMALEIEDKFPKWNQATQVATDSFGWNYVHKMIKELETMRRYAKEMNRFLSLAMAIAFGESVAVEEGSEKEEVIQ